MQKIYFSYLKSDEIHALALRLLPIIELLLTADAYLTAYYARLKKRINDLTIALGVVRSSKFTTLLADADTRRDRYFLGFRNYVSAYLYHPDEKLVQAARLLDTLIETHGATLYNYGYAAETSQLNALLEDLKSTTAQAAITTIQATFWVEILVQAQQEFESIYQQKVATEAAQDLPLISESKNDIVQYLTRMLQYIDTNIEIDAAKFKPVVDKIDEVIVDVMRIARSRKSKQNDAKTNAVS